jgi:hypothetical protein
MTEEISTPSFCEVCGVDVSPNTDLKRFGKIFCSTDHMEQYTKAKQKGRGEEGEYDENSGEKIEKEKGWRRFLREFIRGCC